MAANASSYRQQTSTQNDLAPPIPIKLRMKREWKVIHFSVLFSRTTNLSALMV